MNYRTTLLLTLASLMVIIILHAVLHLNLWWMLLPILFLKTMIIRGSARIDSGFFLKTLCSGPTSKNEIAVTFDDGPDSEYSPEILKTLDEYEVKATFFVIGKNIRGNEYLIKKMDEKGHLIGNHTYSHSFFIDFKNTTSFTEEINRTSRLVEDITGRKMRLFRPPFGVTTPAIAKATRILGLDVIGWNIRSLDTTSDKRETIYNRVIKEIKPGAIILFHDTSLKTNDVLKRTLEFAKTNGIRIVPLTDLLNIRAYN